VSSNRAYPKSLYLALNNEKEKMMIEQNIVNYIGREKGNKTEKGGAPNIWIIIIFSKEDKQNLKSSK
jgi:hypothetical protein